MLGKRYLTNEEEWQELELSRDRLSIWYYIFGVLVVSAFLLLIPSCQKESYAGIMEPRTVNGIKPYEAVRAIIGEASDQGPDGMILIACAIRNRGTLKGVYGLHANHVDTEPDWIWEQAWEAWDKSENYRNCACLKGADHWESIKFIKPSWANRMEVTYVYKDHIFYRKRGG